MPLIKMYRVEYTFRQPRHEDTFTVVNEMCCTWTDHIPHRLGHGINQFIIFGIGKGNMLDTVGRLYHFSQRETIPLILNYWIPDMNMAIDEWRTYDGTINIYDFALFCILWNFNYFAVINNDIFTNRNKILALQYNSIWYSKH